MKKIFKRLAFLLLLSSLFAAPGHSINKDELAAKWKDFKGHAQEKWGEITDDDWTRIKGNYHQLVAYVQDKYGIAKEKAEALVNEWLESIKENSGKIQNKSETVGEKIKEDAKKTWKKTKRVAKKVVNTLTHKSEAASHDEADTKAGEATQS